jgi:hypothetical protein
MYNISEDLKFKPIEKITTYTNPEIERREKNEKIKNKYYELYQPSKNLQRRI